MCVDGPNFGEVAWEANRGRCFDRKPPSQPKPEKLPCGCHCTGGCVDPYAACADPCPEHVPF